MSPSGRQSSVATDSFRPVATVGLDRLIGRNAATAGSCTLTMNSRSYTYCGHSDAGYPLEELGRHTRGLPGLQYRQMFINECIQALVRIMRPSIDAGVQDYLECVEVN